MTARVWKGKTRIEHSETYAKIIEERDIPEYRRTDGFIKLTFLKRSDNEFTYFELLTFWTDLENIKNFTGPNFEQAVSYKEDKQYLVDFPGNVAHYEVFAE
ncbi:antibiotic biosynthesis monooxygenase family protein [Ulvibacterium marinum]|uniref:antibiotic biosynthesis monooxygenase family protein n=1 Tax=Ulvibacterium marinum TaxID=2419782 RepID=UPI0024955CF6|nr:antibiotic biosynthesis monooxygenase [Ulvibacterium marinum]